MSEVGFRFQRVSDFLVPGKLPAVVERDCVTDVLIAAQHRDNSGGNFDRVFRKNLLRQINTAFTSDQRNDGSSALLTQNQVSFPVPNPAAFINHGGSLLDRYGVRYRTSLLAITFAIAAFTLPEELVQLFALDFIAAYVLVNPFVTNRSADDIANGADLLRAPQPVERCLNKEDRILMHPAFAGSLAAAGAELLRYRRLVAIYRAITAQFPRDC